MERNLWAQQPMSTQPSSLRGYISYNGLSSHSHYPNSWSLKVPRVMEHLGHTLKKAEKAQGSHFPEHFIAVHKQLLHAVTGRRISLPCCVKSFRPGTKVPSFFPSHLYLTQSWTWGYISDCLLIVHTPRQVLFSLLMNSVKCFSYSDLQPFIVSACITLLG